MFVLTLFDCARGVETNYINYQNARCTFVWSDKQNIGTRATHLLTQLTKQRFTLCYCLHTSVILTH